MDAERYQKSKGLFAEAAELDPARWPAFLDERCGDDEALRAELGRLLEAHRQASDFLETPARQPPEGRQIGPYKLRRLLGGGGMGTVYLAKRADEEFQKRVALKLLKPGLESSEFVRRFRAERQILAGLDHPGIAKLLDGGTTDDGLPYFVMEYVEGRPLDEHCDRLRLSTSERLKLFESVCQVVHFAHQNLVVHRDLKPANILITADGTPKLLDFGIAKLLNPELASRVAAPTLVFQAMTPDYASPEQIRGEPITTASDVYSLGVLLYGLLTGHLPYHASGHTPAEMERIICEEEPEKLSTAVLREEEVTRPDGSTTTLTPGSVSRTRASEPERLHRRLQGDLDNIVLKALSKEPQRRYRSAEALAADVRRHLAGQPVAACGDAVLYRCRKFVLRHRLGVAAAASLVVLLVAFGLTMAHERDLAEQERQRAERVTGFLTDLITLIDPFEGVGTPLSAREILHQGTATLETLDEQPETKALLMDTIGVIYQRLGMFDRAEPLLRSALSTRQELWGERHEKVAESLDHLGLLKLRKSEHEAAEELFREALAIRQDLFGDEHTDVARSLHHRALLLWHTGRHTEAETLFREALALQRKLPDSEHPDVADSLNDLAGLLRDQGEYGEAERLVREALELLRRHLGQRHPHVASTLSNLASLLRYQGHYDEAEARYRETLAIFRELFGDEHPTVATVLNNLATVLRDRGDSAQAEELYREALRVRRKVLGDLHPHVGNTLYTLAPVLQQRGDYEAAEKCYREALDVVRKNLGEEHPRVGFVLVGMANLSAERRDFAEAERLVGQALQIYAGSLPGDHWRVSDARGVRADSLTADGRHEEAEALLLDAYEVLRSSTGESSPYTRKIRSRLVALYEAWDKPDRAAELREEPPDG